MIAEIAEGLTLTFDRAFAWLRCYGRCFPILKWKRARLAFEGSCTIGNMLADNF
jgi:hypothetical protein